MVVNIINCPRRVVKEEMSDDCQCNYPKMEENLYFPHSLSPMVIADNHKITCKFKEIIEFKEICTGQHRLRKLISDVEYMEKLVDCLEVGLIERQEASVVNEDHNWCNEEDRKMSSSLSELDNVGVVKLDHNFFEDGYQILSSMAVLVPQHQRSMDNTQYFYKDDPGRLSRALGQVRSVQQPSIQDILVVQEDHNHYEDPAVSSSYPAVPRTMVLAIRAYLKDRHMVVNPRVFHIPSDNG